jgi:DMSO/TMAO reductase YedYZ heme-binding membrane subunit
MNFLIVLIVAAVVVYAIEPAIKKAAPVFYLLAAAADVAYIVSFQLFLPLWFERIGLVLVQKCTLALALLTIVMFIGCFKQTSRIRLRLQPIRGQLSVMGCILALGHIAMYLSLYLPNILRLSVQAHILVSLVVALALFLLVAVLGVTSLNFIKRRMSAKQWKRVQLLAYPFYLLVYIHLMISLSPVALNGSSTALTSVVVYSALFIAYTALRIRLMKVQSKDAAAELASETSQG